MSDGGGSFRHGHVNVQRRQIGGRQLIVQLFVVFEKECVERGRLGRGASLEWQGVFGDDGGGGGGAGGHRVGRRGGGLVGTVGTAATAHGPWWVGGGVDLMCDMAVVGGVD